MTISVRSLLKNTTWTVGAYGVSLGIRFVTSIILARLLAPELFGTFSVLTSVRLGIEFLSDVGISQNVVYSANANDPDFYNTAWTLQVIRSIGLWLISLIIAIPVARFYQSPILITALPLVVFNGVIFSFSSLSTSLMQKRLLIARLNFFEVIFAFVCAASSVTFAYISPTIWALVFSGLFQSAIWMVSTHFFLPDVKHQFRLSKRYISEIFHFGKWIFVASIVYFLSTNFDRLYFAKVVGLEVLGIYGIARSISEMFGAMVFRFGYYVVFPLISSHHKVPRYELRQQLGPMRGKTLLLVGMGFSVIVAVADLPIKILYDQRYQAAAWMVPLLIIGSWFSLLANINESTLLGLGKPSYGALGNSLKFIFLLIGLPLSVKAYGLVGGIAIVSISDLFRYFPILFGQKREGFSFMVQDFLVTLTVFVAVVFWEVLRNFFGLGNSFESLPIQLSTFSAGGR
jgi:O-antigen/teichoic acid export membrane protein